MKPITGDDNASALPVVLFVLTIIVCGALYSLLFIEVAFPMLKHFIPESDSKTFIMMCIYAIPLFVLIVGLISVIKEGIKEAYRI